MTDFLPPDILGAAAPVVKEALESFAPTIRRGAGSIAKNWLDKTIANLQIGFSPYLHTSYDRCRSVKTLLSQDRPLSLLDIYVHLTLSCGDNHLSDDELIQKLEDYRRVVVTGLAGSGKSMFNKYLIISRFLTPRGMIPLFVELRQLNALTSKNLLAYIHQFCASAENKVTFDQFELALRTGGLLLALDGFDEIDFTHRDVVSGQILEIASKYPNAVIVVSGRPDDKFAAWQNFHTFTVDPLTKEQSLELIDKIDYEEDLKNRFRQEVDRRLYDSHKSFLSSPLLSSIMLLTYEQFAEIPNKMHIFYEQAFFALFKRHDAQKSQFIRKTYTGLAIDDFKKFFSAFCVFSYLDEKFTFLDAELKNLTTRALRYARVKAQIESTVKDLYECVCILQRDGIHTVFVHRSFQEYFTAVFASSYHGKQIIQILDKFAHRTQDKVIPMLYEITKERIDSEWILPHVNEFLQAMDNTKTEADRLIVYRRIITGAYVSLQVDQKREIKLEYATGILGPEVFVFYCICELWGNKQVLLNILRATEDIARKPVVSGETVKSLKNGDPKEIFSRFGKVRDHSSSWTIDVELDTTSAAKLATVFEDFIGLLRSIKAGIERRAGDQESMVEMLLKEAMEGPLQTRRKRGTSQAADS